LKVIVAGAGQVGGSIARYLAQAGNNVTVIDQRGELVYPLGERFDIQAVVGLASLPTTLDRAGAKDADMLIAVTSSDEVNMIACQVAHTLFDVPTKIARVRQQDYRAPQWQDLFRRDHLPIDVVISPEVEVAHAIALRLDLPGSIDVLSLADDRVRVIAVRCDAQSPIIDTPLRQLTYLFPDLHLVCIGIVRGDAFFIPDADDQLVAGDEVYFTVETAQIARVLPLFGRDVARSERVLIAGGGNIGLFLAGELEDRHRDLAVCVIEPNPGRATLLADRLKRAIVLKGDARDPDLLAEAGVGVTHAIVTVTNDDEVNIMASLLAKRLGCRRALALVNNTAYEGLIETIGIDVAINPRDTTVSSVLQHVRRGRIRAAHTLRDGVAEVVEAEVLETSPVVGKQLREVRPPGTIVGAVIRGAELITPRGETVIRARDRLIVAARADAIRKVEQLFAVRLDYF
jgi:trk system potassium uptake protein TrkA